LIRFIVFLALLVSASSLSAQKKPQTESERLGAKCFNQASEAFSSKQYAKSIPLFIAADSLIGHTELVDRVKLRYALAVAYLKSDKPDSALIFFEWVAEQDSTYPYVHLQAAECARKMKKNSLALKFYKKALTTATEQEKPIILGKIGEIQYKRGELQGALRTLNKAIALSPSPSFYLLRGRIFDRLAEPLDHAGDEDYDFEGVIQSGKLTEEQMLKAVELRQKALDDYRVAAEDEKLTATAKKLITRSEIILENNRAVISEIRYQRENP